MHRREDITFEVEDRRLTATVLSPLDVALAARPGLLLTFASDRDSSLFTQPYCRLAEALLGHGHRAASFDLPCHGDRVDEHGAGIEGFCASIRDGVDPFAGFVREGRAVISELIGRELAEPGRVVVAGVSRGGYCALRLFAGDDRIVAATGLAPVTDWRLLSEFEHDTERPAVRELRLSRFAKPMVGRGVHLAIGREDARVGTDACRALYEELVKTNTAEGYDDALVQFDLTDDLGHTMGEAGYERGSQFLLDMLGHTGAGP